MANSKKQVETVSPETKTVNVAPEVEVNKVPNVASEAPNVEHETDEQILARLTDAYFAASENISLVAASRDRAKIAEASKALDVARIALEKHEGKIKAIEAEAQKAKEFTGNVSFIASKFGVTDDVVKQLLEADKADANMPLRNALANVFGGKVVAAKAGLKGTDLTKSNKAPEATNGEAKAPEAGSKMADMLAMFEAGKTKDEFIAAGYTDSDLNNATYKFRYIRNKETGGYMKNPKYHTV